MPFILKVSVVSYLIIAIIDALSITYIYSRAQKKPDMYRLLACHIVFLLWMVFGIIETLSKGTEFYQYAVRIALVPVSTISTFVLRFALHYSAVIEERYAKWTRLLFIPTIVLLTPLYIKKLEPLVITRFDGNVDVIQFGPLITAVTYLSYCFLVISVVLIYKKMLQIQGIFYQKLILVVSVLLPGLLSFLQINGVVHVEGIDLTVISITMLFFVLWNLVMKYNFIDVVPKAAYSVYSRLRDAIFIVDINGKLIETNSAVETYFKDLVDLADFEDINLFFSQLENYSEDHSIVKQIVKRIQDNKKIQLNQTITPRSHKDDETMREVIHSVVIVYPDKQKKYFNFSVVPIFNESGAAIGQLIQCRDVTEYRMYTLEKERIRLSNDLHDSIGNCLNIISSNLEYVLNHYDNTTDNKQYLQTSYHKTCSAFIDMRRIVNELNPIEIEKNGLVWALENLFNKLKRNRIIIDFYCNEVNSYLLNDNELSKTIYYICQEALHNAVSHGQANNISVVLNIQETDIRLYISDDGVGCDEIIENTGLNSIRSRVEALNGIVEYGSPTNGGFHIKASFLVSGIAV